MQRIDELGKSRPYQAFTSTPGKSFYEWSEERVASGEYVVPAQLERFKEILDTPIEVFSYSIPLQFQLVEKYGGGLPGFLEAVYLLECEIESSYWLDLEYASAREYFSREKEIDRESLQRIGAERDILETQVRRDGEQIREIAGQAAKILLAWISEALFVIEGRQGGPELAGELSRMVREVKFFWERFGKGFPLSDSKVRQWLSTLHGESLDADFLRGQVFGLLLYTGLRDRISSSAMKLNNRRVALEYLLYFILNEVSPTAAENILVIRPNDGRVKGAHLQVPMVQRYYQILDTQPEISPPKARSLVLEEFESPVDDRQFQRYIQKLPRYY